MARRGEVARVRAGERRAHARVLLSEEGDDRRQRGGLGLQLEMGQVSGPWPFPLYFFCVFLFLLFCFDLV